MSPMTSRRLPKRPSLLTLTLLVAVLMLIPGLDGGTGSAVAQTPTQPIDGSCAPCTDFRVVLANIPLLDQIGFDITDEGWVRANRCSRDHRQFRSVSGQVKESFVTHKDTPANHDTHDQGTDVEVDVGLEDVLSTANGPNKEDLFDDINVEGEPGDLKTPTGIELEWETGIKPSDHFGDGSLKYLPKWAWPVAGDRVWANGEWVFDCGHAKERGLFVPNPDPNLPPIKVVTERLYRTEIHPPRAIAAMRNQVGLLPGSGTTQVPVTATDLYIHGQGGYVTQQLNCGMGIIVDGVDEDGDGSGDGNPDACPVKTTPIDDLFEFDVCLPPKPSIPGAVLSWSVAVGPGNMVNAANLEPTLTPVAAPGGCANSPEALDAGTAVHVKIQLQGSGVAPEDIYARKILAGWVFPDPVRHLSVTLNKMELHDKHEFPGADGELSFFWVNLNRGADEWVRLSDFEMPEQEDCTFPCPNHTNKMEDFDDSCLCCSGGLKFSGLTWDFHVREGQDFSIGTTAYEQDCYDRHFGDHHFSVGTYVNCYGGQFLNGDAFVQDWGQNDKVAELHATFGPASVPPYGIGSHRLASEGENGCLTGDDPEFHLAIDVAETPVTQDPVDLKVTKSCAPDTGLSFVCTITAENPGPGLPKDVTVQDTLSTSLGSSDYAVETPTFVFEGFTTPPATPCNLNPPNQFTCNLGTVPVGSKAVITFQVTVNSPGRFTDVASVSSSTVDPDAGNNQATASIIVVRLDIRPGAVPNAINVKDTGVVVAAILGTPDFDATTVDFSTVCFGDAENLAERDCTEAHAKGHVLNADKDKRLDMVLHYEIAQTGIDPGDTQACLMGRTFGGEQILGCDSVKTE